MSFTAADRSALLRAAEVAQQGIGEVEPNPPVGAVLFRGEQVLAEGFHRAYGAAHAEVGALENWARDVPADASLAVTLEPCSSVGKQPACTDAVLRAGIRRVVVGELDPDPRHGGRGLDLLRQAGVEVVLSPDPGPVAGLLDEFRRALSRRRPLCFAKWAMSLDATWGPAPGIEERAVSGAESHAEVHRLRRHVDAILIGSGTALEDDPQLTARVPGPLTPLRIVLDGRGRLPADSRLVETRDQAPVLWVTRPGVSPPANGVEHWELDDPHDLVGEVLPRLRARGVNRLLVEGGPTITGEFLRQELIDRAWVFVAPRWFAGECSGGPRLDGGMIPDECSQPTVEGVDLLGCDARFRLRWR